MTAEAAATAPTVLLTKALPPVQPLTLKPVVVPDACGIAMVVQQAMQGNLDAQADAGPFEWMPDPMDSWLLLKDLA